MARPQCDTPPCCTCLVFGQKYYFMPKACMPIWIPNWESIFPFSCPPIMIMVLSKSRILHLLKKMLVTLWLISFITSRKGWVQILLIWRSSWMAFIQERRIVIPMEWLYSLVKFPFFWCLILHVYG
jgi:hypothetical protein